MGFKYFTEESSVTEEGVTFAYKRWKENIPFSRDLDGDSAALGADIAMVFDECLGWG